MELRKKDLHGSVSDPLLDTMNFLNEVTHRFPDAISFAPGRPYDAFFETGQILTHVQGYLDHLGGQGYPPERVRDRIFQYGPTAGVIRAEIADWLRKDEGIEAAPEAIVVTVGCQEAMLLCLRALFAGPDDVLLVSTPCYVGITGAARLLDIEVAEVRERADGLHCADVEAAVAGERARGRNPRALYVLPDHANPSGNTMPAEARAALLATAERLGLLLLEDSPYRLVSPGAQLPTLKALDRDQTVVHLGSFSKTLFPGARVGFVLADQLVSEGGGSPGLLADEISKIKSMVTVNTSPLSQAAVAGMLLAADGRASRLNELTSAHYGEAMRSTLAALAEHFPERDRAAHRVDWNKPSGGFFLSLNVPFAVDNAALEQCAEEFGVIWTPMSYFYPLGGGESAVRLSVSYLGRAEIDEGIARLARFVRSRAHA